MPLVSGVVRGESETRAYVGPNDYVAIYAQSSTYPQNLDPHKISAANLMQGSFAITANASVSAAGTALLTVGTNNVLETYTFAAGSGAYTYNIDLNATGAKAGSAFMLNITVPASANPTIKVRNGSGGTALVTINDAAGGNYDCLFVFDGTNWSRIRCVKNSY